MPLGSMIGIHSFPIHFSDRRLFHTFETFHPSTRVKSVLVASHVDDNAIGLGHSHGFAPVVAPRSRARLVCSLRQGILRALNDTAGLGPRHGRRGVALVALRATTLGSACLACHTSPCGTYAFPCRSPRVSVHGRCGRVGPFDTIHIPSMTDPSTVTATRCRPHPARTTMIYHPLPSHPSGPTMT